MALPLLLMAGATAASSALQQTSAVKSALQASIEQNKGIVEQNLQGQVRAAYRVGLTCLGLAYQQRQLAQPHAQRGAARFGFTIDDFDRQPGFLQDTGSEGRARLPYLAAAQAYGWGYRQRQCVHFVGFIDEDHHLRDCRIEVQIIVILGYLLDCLMVNLVQFMRVDGCDAVPHFIVFIQK